MVKGADGQIYVFGGYIEGRCTDEMWRFDPTNSQWKRLETRLAPTPRANHTATMWHSKSGEVMLVMGGVTQNIDRLNDLWMYRIEANAWEEVKFSLGPGSVMASPRSEHSAVLYHDHLVVFGGRSSALKELNDVMILNLNTMKWAIGSELCLHPLPDKSFSMGLRESPSPGKSVASKGVDSTFTAVAGAEAQRKPASPQSSSSKGKEPSPRSPSPNSPSPLHHKRKKASPPKLRAAEIESALEELKILTPTTSSMLHSVVMYAGEKALEPYFQSMKRRKRLSGLFSLSKQLESDEGYCVRGRVPCARSGQTAEVYDNFMIIFAGDRSQVALNDVYLYDLSKEAAN